MHNVYMGEYQYILGQPCKKKPPFGYRGVGTEKCQLRHDCLIVYGTICVCDQEKIIINYDHLLMWR